MHAVEDDRQPLRIMTVEGIRSYLDKSKNRQTLMCLCNFYGCMYMNVIILIKTTNHDHLLLLAHFQLVCNTHSMQSASHT